MPVSIRGRIEGLEAKEAKRGHDAPTRFDLYSLEDGFARLKDSVKELAGLEDSVSGLDKSVEELTKQCAEQETAIKALTDQVEELRKAVDALTNVIDRLPENMGER